MSAKGPQRLAKRSYCDKLRQPTGPFRGYWRIPCASLKYFFGAQKTESVHSRRLESRVSEATKDLLKKGIMKSDNFRNNGVLPFFLIRKGLKVNLETIIVEGGREEAKSKGTQDRAADISS